MLDITAADARQLQKTGIPQAEMYEAALSRCAEAIKDQAKKGKSSVEVAVVYLDEKSRSKLLDVLHANKFTAEMLKCEFYATNLVKIGWGDK